MVSAVCLGAATVEVPTEANPDVMLCLSVTGPESFTGLDTGVIANILISDVCVDVSFIQEYLNAAAYDGILYLDRLYELLLDMHFFFYFLNFFYFSTLGIVCLMSYIHLYIFIFRINGALCQV